MAELNHFSLTDPGEAPPSLRLLVSASDSLLRESIAAACRARADTLVTACRDGFDALAEIVANGPDIALVAACMRNLSALQLVRLVRAAGCPTKVIVISDEHSEVAIGMYLRRGMDGYLLDNQPTHQIHSALEYVADGGCYIPPVFRRSRIELELDRADVRPARTVATPARKRRARVRR